MTFKNFLKLSLSKIEEESIKDQLLSLNKSPLFESPIYYESDFFQELNNLRTNHHFALERVKEDIFIENVFIKNKNYQLYRNHTNDYVWDFFISGDNGGETIYGFVKYKTTNNIIELGGLWQIEWVIGLIKDCLLTYYSKHFQILESGNISNKKGKKFYQKLAREFSQNGKRVTVILDKKEIPYNISDEESYWNNSDMIPSFEKRFRYYF